jgi:glycosyltransferase involved in cell wall biosynthesis
LFFGLAIPSRLGRSLTGIDGVTPVTGLRVLIADFNLFDEVGGGQTVYRNIIRRRPQDTFYYFGTSEKPDTPRPANAVRIPFKSHFGRQLGETMPMQRHFAYVFREAIDMARSTYALLGGASFDAVDTPDYFQNGLFLRRALESHGIGVGEVALALHGTISSALTRAWPWTDDPAGKFAALRLRESLQFRAADTRYGISDFYAQELQRRADHPVAIVDPLLVIRDTTPKLAPPSKERPDLVFIGRREKRKGPDLFVDMAWWLPENSYRRLLLIGADGHNHQGSGSDALLETMARRRGVKPEFLKQLSQQELRDLCGERTVVFVPSRYDQFNLVALEALLEGCPTVVGRNVGVARFIEQRLPELKWLVTDLTCDRSAALPLESMLGNYDAKRCEIVEALQRARLQPDFGSLDHMYGRDASADAKAQATLSDMFDRFSLLSLRGNLVPALRPARPFLSSIKKSLRPVTRNPAVRAAAEGGLRTTKRALVKARAAYREAKDIVQHPKDRILKAAGKGAVKAFGLDVGAAREFFTLRSEMDVRRHVIFNDERGAVAQRLKLRYLSDLVQARRLDRVRIFREMIRVERLLGNDLIAATYGLRLLRWLGHDHFSMLPFIAQTLESNGYRRESEAAAAMYGTGDKAEATSLAFLRDQFDRNLVKPDLPLEVVDDRRGKGTFRASIIVSLYNAASKMSAFMRMLSQQTMVQSGECEIVFVDSGSPTDEYGAFKQLVAAMPMQALFVRSQARETIQMAWNRGIKLAKSDYLAFLGVDEAVHPDCMHLLARELDENPGIDWVMADSIVTEVDRHETFDHDVMTYDRRGYRQDWHYLDCTFLSYVGGLYRRSIHDRCGYYDESFRAAGDTEFKNRILPHIRSKRVPKLLGLFNNYPEERTTQHPRAEIEDLRAWYLHRSVGGVAYAFDERPTSEVVELIKDTLRYRKCYCQHWSTDLDYAASLSAYVSRRSDAGAWAGAHAPIDAQLGIYRGLELFPNRRRAVEDQFAFYRSWTKLRAARETHRQMFGLAELPAYDLLNDNRYEQHWWSWS